MLYFRAPSLGQPLGQNLAVTDVHVGAAAHKHNGLARSFQRPQPLDSLIEVGNRNRPAADSNPPVADTG
jgi:hypothetical protein